MSTETEKEDSTTDREQNDERDEWHDRVDLRRALVEAYARLEYVNDETPDEEVKLGCALDDVLEVQRYMDTAACRGARDTFEERVEELLEGDRDEDDE